MKKLIIWMVIAVISGGAMAGADNERTITVTVTGPHFLQDKDGKISGPVDGKCDAFCTWNETAANWDAMHGKVAKANRAVLDMPEADQREIEKLENKLFPNLSKTECLLSFEPFTVNGDCELRKYVTTIFAKRWGLLSGGAK